MQVTRYQSVSGILAVSVSKMAVLMKILACLRSLPKLIAPVPIIESRSCKISWSIARSFRKS